jgi:protein-S-isoprenylcysteine O-methyltransferase Ste14
MVAATALTQGFGRWAALFLAVVCVVIVKVHAEERLLSDEFSDEYERYRARVPRIVPRLPQPLRNNRQ